MVDCQSINYTHCFENHCYSDIVNNHTVDATIHEKHWWAASLCLSIFKALAISAPRAFYPLPLTAAAQVLLPPVLPFAIVDLIMDAFVFADAVARATIPSWMASQTCCCSLVRKC